MTKEKVLNNISFVVGIVTVLLIVIFSNNLLMAGIIAGVGFFLYGVCAAINKKLYGLLIMSISFSLFFTLLLYKYNFLNKDKSVTFMVCSSVFLLMLITMIVDITKERRNLKVFSLKVEGEVIDLIKNHNTKKDYYRILYSYTINDKSYVVESLNYVNKCIPNIGDKKIIYVNPLDNASVFFDRSVKDKIIDWFTEILLLIVTIVIIISLFW